MKTRFEIDLTVNGVFLDSLKYELDEEINISRGDSVEVAGTTTDIGLNVRITSKRFELPMNCWVVRLEDIHFKTSKSANIFLDDLLASGWRSRVT